MQDRSRDASAVSVRSHLPWQRALRVVGTPVLILTAFLLVDVERVGPIIASIELADIGIVIALSVSSWWVAIIKFKVLVRDVEWAEVAKLHFIGTLYNHVLPGQIAGEAVRAIRLGQHGLTLSSATASVLVDRLTGLIGLGLVAGIGLAVTPTSIPHKGLFAGVIIAGTVLSAVALFALPPLLSRFARLASGPTMNQASWSARPARWLKAGAIALEVFAKDTRSALISTLLGCVYQVVGVAIVAVLAHAFALQLSFADAAWTLGIVAVAMLLPVSIGGLGVRELGFVTLLGSIGIEPAGALSLAIACSLVALSSASIGLVIQIQEWTKRSAPR